MENEANVYRTDDEKQLPTHELDASETIEAAIAEYEELKAKADIGDITPEEQAKLDELESMKGVIH